MDKQNYKPRVIDAKVKEYLSAFGAVCIEGPKWCGKTWTSSYHSKSEIYIGDPANNFQNRQLAELSPALVLEGDTPRLIDEWQEVPSIWDAVRYKVDQVAEKGQFILTGSLLLTTRAFCTAVQAVLPSYGCVLCPYTSLEIPAVRSLWKSCVMVSWHLH